MFEGLGSGAYRFRYLIVAAWIAAAVLSYVFAPSLSSQGTVDQAAFLPPSASSAIAEKALAKAFPGSTATSSATITFTRDAGLTEADRAYLDGFGSWSQSADAPQALRDVVTSADTARSRPELASMLASDDGRLELLNVNLSIASAGDEAAVVVAALREHAASTAPAGLAVHVTGTAGITTDYLDAIKSGTDSTTKVTVVLVLLILLLIYRAPLAALVPLVTIGAAFLVARAALGLLAAAGWHVSSLLDTFVVVLVFGVGTDYTIFLISRYREEVSAGDWHDASRRTVRRIGAVITASAATVIVGLGAMAFGSFEMIRSTGPALGVAIAVTLVAGLTLAPALLGIFGHFLFWPQHARTGNAGEPDGFFARLADIVTRHPGSVTAALIIALLVPAAFVPQVKTNFDTLAELPAQSDARLGYEEVATHLGKGKLVQSTGLIDAGARSDILSPASLALLRDTLVGVSGTPGVASVTSLLTPEGDGVVPDGFRPSIQLRTIAESFSSDSSSSDSSSTSSLLDPELSSGLSSALDYVNALGLAFPDIAGRSEFRAATSAITNAQDIVERVRLRSIVSTQLRSIAAALLSPTAIIGGSAGDSSDTKLIGDYLDEFVAAYPQVRPLAAFADATAAAATLERAPTAAAAVAAADALNQLAVHFDATPTATLVAKSLANTPSALEAKREATAAFDALPGAVRGLAGAYAGRSDDIFVPVGLGGEDAAALEDAVNAFVTADRTATRFYVTATDDPYAGASFAMVRAVQADLSAAAPSFGVGASASLGGSTAQLADVQTVLANDFERVGIITVLGILLVLALLLRAIVAPIYLVATVLLSYASAVGLAGWFFQGPLAQPGVSFYLPLLVFVLLVALGSDYNIFLMSRVREESETRPMRDGIRVASGRTGAVITSAGLILAGTFGSMATAELAVLFQIGVAVAIGVLIDTFLVRSILVPAITMLMGDRAWWPTGFRLVAGRWLQPPAGVEPGGTPAGSAVASAALPPVRAESRPRRPIGVSAAVVVLILLPAIVAGLLLWAGRDASSAPIGAAIVNGDEGAMTTAGDGSSEALHFGDDLAAALLDASSSDDVSWTVTDAVSAADGLRSGTYDAVLTIPAGYSRALAAVRADRAGSGQGPTLHLQTKDASAAGPRRVARDIAAAVSAISTRHATESYLADLLLAVSTTGGRLRQAVPSARDIATRTTALATDATGIATVSEELVSGLGVLAWGTAQAVDGAQQLTSATRALAGGAERLATGAGSFASGAADAATGASQLSSGASLLADGLAALDGQTAALPTQASALTSGAATLASGATAAATGAEALASGLESLEAQTAGLGSNVAALDSAAGSLAAGTTDLATGATGAAAGATALATGASQLEGAVDAYASSVDALAAGCAAMGGGAAVCAALAGISASSGALSSAADGVASGADGLAGATSAVANGATDLETGAALLHGGTAALAASAPQLESAIALSAAGATSLSTGTAGVATGAAALANGLDQLTGGMPALAAGVSDLSTAGATVAAGASSLATGVSRVSTGSASLAAGIRTTAEGAAALATGMASSAAGASQLSDALGQAVDGATVQQAQIGQLVRDGESLAGDAGTAASALKAAATSASSQANGAEAQLAARAATPVVVVTGGSVETSFIGARTVGVSLLGVALIALAAWLLGALFAAVVVAPRRRYPAGTSTPGWRSPAAPRPA